MSAVSRGVVAGLTMLVAASVVACGAIVGADFKDWDRAVPDAAPLTQEPADASASTPASDAASDANANANPSPAPDPSCATPCATGQRCVNGACVCDPQTCTGCCAGTTCRPGTTANACGAGGATCAACTGNTTCTAGACAPTTTRQSAAICHLLQAGSEITTCDTVCNNHGWICTPGCLADFPNAGGERTRDTTCQTPATRQPQQSTVSCGDSVVLSNSGTPSLACCCAAR